MVEKILYDIHKINHCVFAMNFEERIDYLYKIKKYLDDCKDYVINKKNNNVDMNFLNYNIPVFMFAYYGINVKDIIFDISNLYKIIFEKKINEINSQYLCSKKYNKTYKKILFCSGRLSSKSSVYNSTINIIKHLSSRKNFHVDILTKKINYSPIKESYKDCKNVYEKENGISCLDLIGGGRYDVIIYPDMNMVNFNSCLGLFRLAPVQINTFGHSETSGSADYFISSKFYEHENSQDNYSEKLINFNSLALDYPKIIEFENNLSRKYFQIPNDYNIYYCNSSFFKFGKEFFYIIDQILKKDNKSMIILTKLNFPQWDVNFFHYLEQNVSKENINRIKFLNRLNPVENYNMMKISNVYLESYPFGNMNSTLECFNVGLPVVSLPTLKINNRFTYGFYKKIELEKEYCFNKIDDYINKSIEIANSKDENKRKELKEKSSFLFENKDSSIEWENFLLSI